MKISLETYLKKFNYFLNKLDFENRCKLLLCIFARLLFKITKLTLIPDINFIIDGKKLWIKTHLGDFGRIYEIWALRVYEKLPFFCVKEGDICLDIGANFGSVCIRWATVNRKGPIIAVEPYPETFNRLKRNCELNKIDNIECVNAAIGSKSGTCFITPLKDSSMAHVVVQQPCKKLIPISMYSIDDLVAKKLDYITLMKIDVEGYEVECLKGAKETLEITQKVVLEYHSESLRCEVISLLTSKGFSIKDVNGIIYAY